MRKLGVLVVVVVLALGAACGGDDGDGASASGFCAAQAKNVDALQQQQPTSTPASLKELYERLDDTLDEAVDKAPSEIKDDMQTVADAYKPFVDELRKVDYDFTKLNFQSEAFQKLSSQEMRDATQRISAYYERTCK
jgi:hypothetical protein